jgi:hypothetical protein
MSSAMAMPQVMYRESPSPPIRKLLRMNRLCDRRKNRSVAVDGPWPRRRSVETVAEQLIPRHSTAAASQIGPRSTFAQKTPAGTMPRKPSGVG